MARTLYQALFQPVLTPAQDMMFEDLRWYSPWSDPQGTIWKQFFDDRRIAQAGGAFTPILSGGQYLEVVTESRWHQPWSEPVRFKPAVLAGDQAPFFFEPDPVPFYKAYARAYVIT
jgi:hypothetical protein